jgi:hypothetical protein
MIKWRQKRRKSIEERRWTGVNDNSVSNPELEAYKALIQELGYAPSEDTEE